MSTKNEIVTLDSFVRSQKDQELKGLLLKLKNEIRKEDVLWEDIRDILKTVEQFDKELLTTIVPLIISE
ncbi:MAG: hypothetical protein GWO07_06160 [Candidatus Dadabacteria bacterium]|nr:hypothetical protein [Candidatus Dadabacteria bacterium]NIS08336.1 hypothetical protein [Candidatus Dadabacteria bacterium]NIV43114.1 hypothetical protein [Candidatus Dadabacteria bacterium]NIX14728.1 hypothetical protein [Candidatus Dadabacteria bacterium]NIY22245.1 hypothetical protein [Candidatus Dadabacteria bacterium]